MLQSVSSNKNKETEEKFQIFYIFLPTFYVKLVYDYFLFDYCGILYKKLHNCLSKKEFCVVNFN